MSQTPSATARIDGQGARLEATMSVPAPGTVRVRYRLHNTGDSPLAVFDRGNRQAVLSGRQASGAIGAPTFEQGGHGDVVLRHFARVPGSGRFTGPTVPATPLALQLATGAVVEGEFSFAIPVQAPLRRVRWCLGVAAFEEAGFMAPESAEAGTIWQAGDDAVASQQALCTPWFDMAAGAFAGP